MVMDRGSWSAEATSAALWIQKLGKRRGNTSVPEVSGDRSKRIRNVVIRVLKGASTEITSITRVFKHLLRSQRSENPSPRTSVVTLLAAAIGLY